MKIKLHYFLFFALILQSCSKDSDLNSIYGNISAEEIIELETQMTDGLINSTHGDNNQIPLNTILVFKTLEGNYGKMEILNNTVESNELAFKYDLFDGSKQLIINSSISAVRRTWTFDFETNSQEDTTATKDFWWEWNEFNNGGLDGEDKFLVPINGCIYYIYPN